MEVYTKTEKDKHILFASIRLIICVGHADGYIGNKEVSRIHELVNSEHFTLRERQILMDDMDYPKQPETIVKDMVDLSLPEKLGLLRQLYKIALVDQKLSLAETLEIRRISCLLGISEEKQKQVEEWIVEGIQWRDRWKEIVGE
ncbi:MULTISPECIES: TerB family tellurite resistance protein [Brevibacillus]|uniref:TerB family tellurite resistance protein n=1 Tax=Brevibacillus TaxID=55080 RepID=UPI000469CF36|nr:hypothetical protein X546_23655 [Brevibacillus borstelensis cifa_chp40]MBE5394306.1 TerB family tellurite resistance protein [Brevibacillus borstelensis]NOU56274.1 TerB family tellurite resistance protein [Brevibacillus borstelensis]RNB58109.1 TerB family tellurite resistance protein [Brevibacillus borstelensis]